MCRAGVGASTEPEQRARFWYQLFMMLPGAEEALEAHDWALFKSLLAKGGCSQEVMSCYVQRLAQPGADARARSCAAAMPQTGVYTTAAFLWSVADNERLNFMPVTYPAGALCAALSWYRANTTARHFGQTQPWPVNPSTCVTCPVLGVWGEHDTALLEPQMTDSAAYVVSPGRWRYARLREAGHWLTRDAPDELQALLAKHLADAEQSTRHREAPVRARL